MIEATRLSELDEEKGYLRRTIDFINQEIPRIESGLPTGKVRVNIPEEVRAWT